MTSRSTGYEGSPWVLAVFKPVDPNNKEPLVVMINQVELAIKPDQRIEAPLSFLKQYEGTDYKLKILKELTK